MAFPVIAPSTIDNLRREPNENPISDGGKWSLLHGHAVAGQLIGLTWNATGEGPPPEEDNGCFWNHDQYGPVTGIKVKLEKKPVATPDEYGALYACLSNPTTGEVSGYRMRLQCQEALGESHFFFIIDRLDKGVFTELGKTASIEVNQLDELAFAVQGGKLEAFHREEKTEPWTTVLSVADATYSTGFVGLGGEGPNVRFSFLEAGPPAAVAGRTASQAFVALSPAEMATNFQGAYSATTTYQPGQLVTAEEKLWRCRQASTNHAPAEGDFWRLVGSIT